VKASESQARCHGIGAQPAESELIARSNQNQHGSGSRNVRKSESKLDGRVCGLTCLSARGQVGASNEKQPTRCRALKMRHISMLACSSDLALDRHAPAHQAIGNAASPRSMVPLCQVRLSSGTAMRTPGSRDRIVPRATCNSIRARFAPRQKWGP
jgi:hypothetical protein